MTLTREIKEELNMNVHFGKYFMTVDHDYPDFHLNMSVYFCTVNNPDYNLNVHLEAKWLDLNDIDTLDYAGADMPVVKKLKALSNEQFQQYIKN